MENVVIVAKIKIKEGQVSQVYKELSKLHKQTHDNDKGCLQYDLHKDFEDNNTYVFLETWACEKDLDDHMKKEHFLSFVNNTQDKIEKLEINKLEKLKI